MEYEIEKQNGNGTLGARSLVKVRGDVFPPETLASALLSNINMFAGGVLGLGLN